MENNILNKQKFFAQYWEQYVGYHFAKSQGKIYVDGMFIKGFGKETNYLELRPLSSITDDEAIEVAEIGLPDKVLYDYLWIPGTGKAIANSIDKGRQTNTFYPHFRFIDTADYLRSKGFAIPYMGLSVEKQIEYGWIKLIQAK